MELLVAITVFSIMGGIAYGGLQTVIKSKGRIAEVSDSLSELQRIFLFLQQDIHQISPRPIRDETGEFKAALIGDGSSLKFTTYQLDTGTDGTRPVLHRIEYAYVDDRLLRRVWPVLDRVYDTQPEVRQISSSISDFSLSYYNGEWLPDWPTESDKDKSPIPMAIRVEMETKRWGNLERIFLVPQ